MLRKSIFIAVISFVLIPFNSFSQSDEEQIKSVITDLNRDLGILISEGSSRADKILSYTHPHFIYSTKTINVMNVVSKEAMNRQKTAFVLKEMRASGVTAKRKLGSLSDIHVRENLALARYQVDYELFESDRLINKGVQFVELIFRKNKEGKWLIEYMTILNVDEITYKSTCICEIYETKGLKDIITETIVPDGHEADILEDKFSVDESTQPRLVRHGFRDYLWDTNGSIFVRNTDGTEGRKIGVAKSRQEMLLTLLKKEVYPDRCSNVIRKLK